MTDPRSADRRGVGSTADRFQFLLRASMLAN